MENTATEHTEPTPAKPKRRKLVRWLGALTFVAGFLFLGQDPTTGIGVKQANAATPEISDYVAMLCFLVITLGSGLLMRKRMLR